MKKLSLLALIIINLIFITVPTNSIAAAPLQTNSSNTDTVNQLKPQLDQVVAAYRKIIILFDNVSDDEQSRFMLAGRKIYDEKQHLLDNLAASLSTDLRRSIKTRTTVNNIDQFINYVSKDASLHDADRLAFLDLVDELLAIAKETRATGNKKNSLIERLERLNNELKAVQDIYQEELTKIFARFGMRGDAKREKWQEYLVFLKGLITREQILKDYSDETEPPVSAVRGALKDTKNEIYGYDLPKKSILLTFDDGPHRRYTDEILAILKKYNIKAFFFNIGKNLGSVDDKNGIKLAPTAAVSKRALDSGHILANHSYSHPNLTKLSSEARAKEIENTNQLLEKVIGKKPQLFRPPYGAKNADIIKQLESVGMQSYMWNIDSLDWADPIPSSVAQRVLTQIKQSEKGILLLHDIHKQSVSALPIILEELVKEEYTFLILQENKLVASSHPRGEIGLDNKNTVEKTADNSGFYRENWAVVIGVNDYQNWPKLRYCVSDANSIEEILINKFDFKKSNVIKLLNKDATREQIVRALDRLSDTNKVNKEDRVFFFFAGHGATRKLPSGKDLGYIVPVDADIDASQAKAISMTQLQEFCDLIPAKHLYFVIDSCYSGLALTRSGNAPARGRNYLEEVTKRVARQILTAGGADQQVADNGPGGHSIFTWTLLQGMQGLADIDGNGAITASELGAYVSPIVSSLSKQTPVFGNIVGSEGGEFVFELQHESLNEVSKQLDEEAIKLNEELERVQQEIALKRERNSKLREKIEAERNKLRGNQPIVDKGDAVASRGKLPQHANQPLPIAVSKPQTKTAEAQNHHTMGLKYYREKKYDDAIKELQLATNLDPKNVTIVNNLGFTLYKIGKYEESLVWLNKAILLDQNRAVAYINVADAYFKLGKYKEAKPYYEKYMQLGPNSQRIEDVNKALAEINNKK